MANNERRRQKQQGRSFKAKHIFFLFILLSLLSFHSVLYLSHHHFFFMSVSSPPLHKFLRSKPHPAARGPNALPQKLTPALIGAQRGHIHNCPTIDDANKAAYWNDPMGYSDMNFHSPFAMSSSSSGGTSGRGGWNNIRMSMENMIVLAAAMGRTLVLPPDQPFYLLICSVTYVTDRWSKIDGETAPSKDKC
jgi:hypothetical protein